MFVLVQAEKKIAKLLLKKKTFDFCILILLHYDLDHSRVKKRATFLHRR